MSSRPQPTNLKERIAALQQLNITQQSPAAPVISPTPLTAQVTGGNNAAALRAKIAKFEEKGGPAPVPRGSFGLGAPPVSGSQNKSRELYGNRIPTPVRALPTAPNSAVPVSAGGTATFNQPSPVARKASLPSGEYGDLSEGYEVRETFQPPPLQPQTTGTTRLKATMFENYSTQAMAPQTTGSEYARMRGLIPRATAFADAMEHARQLEVAYTGTGGEPSDRASTPQAEPGTFVEEYGTFDTTPSILISSVGPVEILEDSPKRPHAFEPLDLSRVDQSIDLQATSPMASEVIFSAASFVTDDGSSPTPISPTEPEPEYRAGAHVAVKAPTAPPPEVQEVTIAPEKHSQTRTELRSLPAPPQSPPATSPRQATFGRSDSRTLPSPPQSPPFSSEQFAIHSEPRILPAPPKAQRVEIPDRKETPPVDHDVKPVVAGSIPAQLRIEPIASDDTLDRTVSLDSLAEAKVSVTRIAKRSEPLTEPVREDDIPPVGPTPLETLADILSNPHSPGVEVTQTVSLETQLSPTAPSVFENPHSPRPLPQPVPSGPPSIPLPPLPSAALPSIDIEKLIQEPPLVILSAAPKSRDRHIGTEPIPTVLQPGTPLNRKDFFPHQEKLAVHTAAAPTHPVDYASPIDPPSAVSTYSVDEYYYTSSSEDLRDDRHSLESTIQGHSSDLDDSHVTSVLAQSQSEPSPIDSRRVSGTSSYEYYAEFTNMGDNTTSFPHSTGPATPPSRHALLPATPSRGRPVSMIESPTPPDLHHGISAVVSEGNSVFVPPSAPVGPRPLPKSPAETEFGTITVHRSSHSFSHPSTFVSHYAEPSSAMVPHPLTFSAVVHGKVTELPATHALINAPRTPRKGRAVRLDSIQSPAPGDLAALLARNALLERQLEQGLLPGEASMLSPESSPLPPVEEMPQEYARTSQGLPMRSATTSRKRSLRNPLGRSKSDARDLTSFASRMSTGSAGDDRPPTPPPKSPRQSARYLNGFKKITTRQPGPGGRNSVSNSSELSSEDSMLVVTPPDRSPEFLPPQHPPGYPATFDAMGLVISRDGGIGHLAPSSSKLHWPSLGGKKSMGSLSRSATALAGKMFQRQRGRSKSSGNLSVASASEMAELVGETSSASQSARPSISSEITPPVPPLPRTRPSLQPYVNGPTRAKSLYSPSKSMRSLSEGSNIILETGPSLDVIVQPASPPPSHAQSDDGHSLHPVNPIRPLPVPKHYKASKPPQLQPAPTLLAPVQGGKDRPSSMLSVASTTSSYFVPSPLGDMFDSFPDVPSTAPPVPILPGAYRRGVQAGESKPPYGVSPPTSADNKTPTQTEPHPAALLPRQGIRALPKPPA